MPKLAQQPLTELAIRKAKPADKRYDLFDASVRGLGLRVATSGTKSWFMMRRFNGRMLRTTFGRYPEVPLAIARLKAPDVLADMADEQTAGQRRRDLFRVVLDEWLKKDQAKNKSVHQVKVTIQVCWDADRLDLGRVGIRPSYHKLCTATAKSPFVMEAAFKRSQAVL